MSLTREAFEALVTTDPAALYTLFEQQAVQLAALTARVEQLKARLGGHSQNSHRRPVSDGPRQTPCGHWTRSGKARGGQSGHPVHTLAMTDMPDRVVAHHPERCARCGAALAGVPAAAVVRRQMVELPPLWLTVTEHRATAVCCPHRVRPTSAPFPADVTRPAQYGPRLLELGVYLQHYQLLPFHRIGELLVDLYGGRRMAVGPCREHGAADPLRPARQARAPGGPTPSTSCPPFAARSSTTPGLSTAVR